jgi:putative aldouronate transport system permease protein
MIRQARLKKKSSVKRFTLLYVMMIPGLLYILINNYIPMFGIFIAFKDINFTKGIFGSDWIGLKNFEFLFKSSDAFIITRNTIGYNAVFILVNTILALLIAVLLNSILQRKLVKFYQTVVLLPYLISMIIVSYLVYAFLSTDTGFLNKSILPLLGINSISWYNDTKPWPFILVFVNAWKNVGYMCIIYYAAIIGIDTSYYEAASLDGIKKWQTVKYITLPMIKPTIVTLVLLQVGRIFYSDFGLFYQVPMNTGTLFPVTNTIDTYVYRALLQLSDIGMSSAAGVYQSIVGFILVLLANFVVKRVDEDSALF